jgi:ABC-2 type transport system permease protein
MNVHAIRAIYHIEMARTWRTLLQSIVAPVISTSLYFVVFGAAIGSRMTAIGGISYGAFIVPGLIMLSLLTQSISNASFGIFFPKFSGTIYEILSALVSYIEIVAGYVGAAVLSSAEVSTRSTCCRPSGGRSRWPIPSSIWSAGSAGVFTGPPISTPALVWS